MHLLHQGVDTIVEDSDCLGRLPHSATTSRAGTQDARDGHGNYQTTPKPRQKTTPTSRAKPGFSVRGFLVKISIIINIYKANVSAMEVVDMKICKKCDKSKGVEQFSINNRTSDGKNPACKKCVSEYVKARYKNPDVAERRIEYRERNKIRMREDPEFKEHMVLLWKQARLREKKKRRLRTEEQKERARNHSRKSNLKRKNLIATDPVYAQKIKEKYIAAEQAIKSDPERLKKRREKNARDSKKWKERQRGKRKELENNSKKDDNHIVNK